MEAGTRQIIDIFNGTRVLEIPFFQRAYVWGEEQWTRLLEDVENVCSRREPYFMGSVILKQQSTSSTGEHGDVRTVVDGQQRLTSLSILLKVLCLKTGQNRLFDKRFRLDDDTPVLRHNHNDYKAFDTIMDLTAATELKGIDNITRAYTFFMQKLDPTKVDFQYIITALQFVGIDLTIEEDEQQIFDTINSLGVKLTTAELLKNYFFGRQQQEQYILYWRDIFEKDEETKAYWDKEIMTGRYRRTFVDLFFFSFLQIKIQEADYSVKTDDKILFSRVDKLFDSYKRFIKNYCDNDSSALLDGIRAYATVFRQAFIPDIADRELPADAGIERINAIIFAMETTTLIPYILYVEKNVQDDVTKCDLYGFLETYIMRRLVTKANTKNYNQLFTDRLILHQVLSKDQFITYLEKQDDTVNYLPDDEQVRDAFASSVLINKQAAGILYMIESKVRNRRKHSTALLGIGKYSLEHLMPKKWQNHWGELDNDRDVEKRNRKLLTLGNLAIITQALNASIRDADWETKRNGHGKNSGLCKYGEGIETLSPYLDLPEWDEAAIDRRAGDLCAQALESWSK